MSRVSISQLPRAVAQATGAPALTRQRTYDLVVSGIIPATFERGRWYFEESEISKIISTLGLKSNPENQTCGQFSQDEARKEFP